MTHPTQTPHITSYKCVSVSELGQLQKAVETEIHNGWQPYGSLLAAGGGDEARFVQPMVRYAEFHR